jgi:hypothetical protein
MTPFLQRRVSDEPVPPSAARMGKLEGKVAPITG